MTDRDCERSKLVLEIATEGYWDWDLATDRVSLSPRYCAMIGYAPDEAVFDSSFYASLIHPADRERILGAIQDHLQQQCGLLQLEYRMIARDGSEFWVESRGQIVERDGGGKPTRMLGTINDITRRKQDKEALRQSEELYRTMVDTLDGFIYTCSADYRILFMNDRLKERTGYDATGQLCHRALHDLESLCPWCVNDRVFAGETVRWELQSPRDQRWYDISNAPLRMADGTLAKQSIIIDITKRKLAEVEREQYFKFFSISTELMCIAGIDGFFRQTNPAFTRLLGYTTEELQAQPLIELIHPDDRAATTGEIGRQLAGELVTSCFENRYRCKDGTYRWLSWNAIFAPEDQLIYGMARDVTEQKQIQTELIAAREAAEIANQAKNEFLANMSHEIRTPLNGILGMTHLLELTEISLKQRRYLEAQKISAQSLLSMLNDLLDLSKIESGRVELEEQVFSLRQCLGELMKSQVALIHAKGLAFTAEIPDDIPDHLYGDQIRLRQIILNLLGNAVKFTPNGGISLKVALLDLHPESILLSFSLSDSGIGIPDTAREKIFAPFTQADTSTTRKYGGTGLGLTICARLLNLMGGTIAVESREGKGSTFTVTIPFSPGAADPQTLIDHNKALRPRGILLRRDSPPLRILLVEDNHPSRTMCQELIRLLGHQAETAENGLEALKMWETFPFDLILMDIQMPVLDGIEATRMIRDRETAGGRRIPIIALTAHALRQDQKKFLDPGFDGYILKPLDVEGLTKEIRRCLLLGEREQTL